MSTLAIEIQKGKLSQPTRKNFDPKKWEKKIQKFDLSDPENFKIAKLAPLIHKELTSIRKELINLNKQAPKLNKKTLLRLYCSMSNRDRLILNNLLKQHVSSQIDANLLIANGFSLSGIKTDKTPFHESLSLEDVSIQCVDGYKHAISNRINTPTIKSGSKPNLDVLQFAIHESSLSEIYYAFEQLWHGVIWGIYNLDFDDSNKQIHVFEKNNSFQIAHRISQQRKEKLTGDRTLQSHQILQNAPESQKGHITTLTEAGSGKQKKYPQIKLTNLPTRQSFQYSSLTIQHSYLMDTLPPSLLKDKFPDESFNCLNIIEIFKHLSILSSQKLSKLPSNTIGNALGKINLYAPAFHKSKLIRALSQLTGLTQKATTGIINFLIYSGHDKDLWSHPLIQIDSDRLIPLLSSFIDANLQRCTEKWLSLSGLQIDQKGHFFEKTVQSQVKESLEKNTMLSDFSVATQGNFSFEGETEEIDLLFRVGELIVVGELKCIITTDGPSSYGHTLQKMEHASRQAQRKAQFVNDNLEALFAQLNWNFLTDSNYQVQPIVINSNQICIGFPLFGVPITDSRILTNYLSKPQISLFKELDSSSKEIANVSLYETPKEAEANFSFYLNNPPPLKHLKQNIEYQTTKLPQITEENRCWMFSKLTVKNTEPNESLLECDPPFKIKYENGFNKSKVCQYFNKTQK